MYRIRKDYSKKKEMQNQVMIFAELERKVSRIHDRLVRKTRD